MEIGKFENWRERKIMAVYHLLKILEAMIFLFSFSILSAPAWASLYLWSFDDDWRKMR